MTTVGVVVVTYRSAATIEPCLRSLRAATAASSQVVVVDNASDDDSATLAAAADPDALIIRRVTNDGYTRGNNAGIDALADDLDWVVFANPDTVWSPGSIEALIDEASSAPSVGLVSPTLIGDDGAPQAIVENDLTLARTFRGMTRLGTRVRPRIPAASSELTDVEWVHTAAALVPMAVVRETGGFDERFFLFAEDADFCRRIRATGRRVVVTPRVFVSHRGGASVDATNDADEAAALRTRALATYLEKYQGQAARRVFGLVGAVVYGAAGHRGQAREAWKAAVG